MGGLIDGVVRIILIDWLIYIIISLKNRVIFLYLSRKTIADNSTENGRKGPHFRPVRRWY